MILSLFVLMRKTSEGFLTYQGEWEQGLRAMDQAVKDMPRTSHRL